MDEESHLLEAAGCTVRRLEMRSDDIATWSGFRRASVPLRVVWSPEGYRCTKEAIGRFRPDVVHFHNTFPLLSPSALWAARRSGAAVVHTLHNFRPLCPGGNFFRAGEVCELCLGVPPLRAIVHGCDHGQATCLPQGYDGDSLTTVAHEIIGTRRPHASFGVEDTTNELLRHPRNTRGRQSKDERRRIPVSELCDTGRDQHEDSRSRSEQQLRYRSGSGVAHIVGSAPSDPEDVVRLRHQRALKAVYEK